MTRRRRRFLVASSVLVAILTTACWWLAPTIWREFQIDLAERSIAAGRLEDAEARLDLLISEEPGRTRPRLLRVRVLRKLGRITEAEEALQRTVELGLPIEEGRREHDLLRSGDTSR